MDRCGQVWTGVDGWLEKIYKEELRDPYSLANQGERDGQGMWQAWRKSTWKVRWRKLKTDRPLGKHRHDWEDNIKMIRTNYSLGKIHFLFIMTVSCLRAVTARCCAALLLLRAAVPQCRYCALLCRTVVTLC